MNLVKAHDCDFCEKPAAELPVIYDVRVWYEGRITWAWCCQECWEKNTATHGKLGTGRGQKFENVAGGKKLEG